MLFVPVIACKEARLGGGNEIARPPKGSALMPGGRGRLCLQRAGGRSLIKRGSPSALHGISRYYPRRGHKAGSWRPPRLPRRETRRGAPTPDSSQTPLVWHRETTTRPDLGTWATRVLRSPIAADLKEKGSMLCSLSFCRKLRAHAHTCV